MVKSCFNHIGEAKPRRKVGAHIEWDWSGIPETIVFDNGSAFRSHLLTRVPKAACAEQSMRSDMPADQGLKVHEDGNAYAGLTA